MSNQCNTNVEFIQPYFVTRFLLKIIFGRTTALAQHNASDGFLFWSRGK